jgi:hypothetical protein
LKRRKGKVERTLIFLHSKHHLVQIESKSSKYEKITREEGYDHIRFIVEMCGNNVLVAGVFYMEYIKIGGDFIGKM